MFLSFVRIYMFLAYHIQCSDKMKIEKLLCANQSHLMQMVDGWGFQRVLHYTTSDGLECAVYCHAVGNATIANQEMCVAITTMGSPVGPLRLSDISHFVIEHYQEEAHPPLRAGVHGVVHTPNGGSLRTSEDLAAWCDGCTDALTRYHVIFNNPSVSVRKRARSHDPSPDGGI